MTKKITITHGELIERIRIEERTISDANQAILTAQARLDLYQELTESVEVPALAAPPRKRLPKTFWPDVLTALEHGSLSNEDIIERAAEVGITLPLRSVIGKMSQYRKDGMVAPGGVDGYYRLASSETSGLRTVGI